MESALPPGGGLLQRLIPAGQTPVTISTDDRAAILDAYRLDSPDSVRLTLVSTLDGRAAGDDGTSESLTSRVDRTVLGVIRELSDAVLVGAETLRREPGLIPRSTPLVVLSASGELGPGFAVSSGGAAPTSILVATTPSGARRLAHQHPAVETVVLEPDSDGRLPLTAVLPALRARGLRRLAAEGGPTVAAALLRAGLIDELCLTLMPVIGGSPLAVLADQEGAPTGGVPHRLRLVGLMADQEGALYGRWSTR